MFTTLHPSLSRSLGLLALRGFSIARCGKQESIFSSLFLPFERVAVLTARFTFSYCLHWKVTPIIRNCALGHASLCRSHVVRPVAPAAAFPNTTFHEEYHSAVSEQFGTRVAFSPQNLDLRSQRANESRQRLSFGSHSREEFKSRWTDREKCPSFFKICSVQRPRALKRQFLIKRRETLLSYYI